MAKNAKTAAKTAAKYVVAANDMSKIMGLEPVIDTSVSEAELKEAIIANAANIEPADEFEQNTVDVLTELGGVPEGIELRVAVEGEGTAEGTVDENDGVVGEGEGEGEGEETAPVKKAVKTAAPVKIKQTAPAAKAPKAPKAAAEDTRSCYGCKRNTMAGEIDELVSQNTDVADIADALVKKFDREAPAAVNKVKAHLKFLAAKGILTVTEDGYELVGAKKVAPAPKAAPAPAKAPAKVAPAPKAAPKAAPAPAKAPARPVARPAAKK